jgi:hypothetical protein
VGIGLWGSLTNVQNLRNHFLYAEMDKYELFLGLFAILILLLSEYFRAYWEEKSKSQTFRWSMSLVAGWYFLLFGNFTNAQQFTYFQF